MAEVHYSVGGLLFALNLIAGVWGIVAWLTKHPSPMFWYLLRAAQIAVVAQAALGATLLIANHRANDELHYLYGILPLVITLVTEMMRVGAAQQVVGDIDYEKLPEEKAQALALRIFIAETRVMALGCLIIAALALRAGMTSGVL
jgi:hypothetical protein